jgi:hypothetical protein
MIYSLLAYVLHFKISFHDHMRQCSSNISLCLDVRALPSSLLLISRILQYQYLALAILMACIADGWRNSHQRPDLASALAAR